MSDIRTYRVICLTEALTPLTHMRGVAGNEQLINREPVMCDVDIVWLPVLSGNAIRHRLVRKPGAEWLIDQYGLSGKLTLRMLNFLCHGGALTESNSREATGRLAEIREVLPLMRLLGGSLPNQICPGLATADRGTMVCRENRDRIATMLPDGWLLPDADFPPAEEWLSKWQYTRGDASRTHPDDRDISKTIDDAIAGEGLMIFGGEQVNPGAMFVHGFRLHRATTVELGALLWSLHLWGEFGATFGGQASRGHGQLRTQYAAIATDGELVDTKACVDAYREHVGTVRATAITWLFERFGETVPAELLANA